MKKIFAQKYILKNILRIKTSLQKVLPLLIVAITSFSV